MTSLVLRHTGGKSRVTVLSSYENTFPKGSYLPVPADAGSEFGWGDVCPVSLMPSARGLGLQNASVTNVGAVGGFSIVH